MKFLNEMCGWRHNFRSLHIQTLTQTHRRTHSHLPSIVTANIYHFKLNENPLDDDRNFLRKLPFKNSYSKYIFCHHDFNVMMIHSLHFILHFDTFMLICIFSIEHTSLFFRYTIRLFVCHWVISCCCYRINVCRILSSNKILLKWNENVVSKKRRKKNNWRKDS